MDNRKTVVAAAIILALVLSVPRSRADASGQLQNSTGYLNSSGYYCVVGEVLNDGNISLQYVKAIATFYNKSGVVVATDFTYTMVDIVPPTRTTPYKIMLTDENQSRKISRYTVSGALQSTSDQPQKLVILLNSSARYP